MKPRTTKSKIEKDSPWRKRSFDPAQDVGLMLHGFEQDSPGAIMGWHINAALRQYLTAKGYAKRIPSIERGLKEGK